MPFNFEEQRRQLNEYLEKQRAQFDAHLAEVTERCLEDDTRFTCPHCRKLVSVPEAAVMNCDAYGSKTYRLACPACRGPVYVRLHREVCVGQVSEGDFDTDDWGEPTSLST